MKILAIGDVHGDIEKIKKIPLKDIDLILLTGDLGKADLARNRFFENLKREKRNLPEIEETSEFIRKSHMEIYDSSIEILKYLAKHSPIYTIIGNVGMYDSEVKKMSNRLGVKLPLIFGNLKKIKNVKLISNRFVNFNGIKIGGLEYFISEAWINEFNVKDKKRIAQSRKETAKAKKVLKWFGKNKLDILLCHQPPYGVLDKVGNKSLPKNWQGKHAGSKTILNFIKKNKILKYVLCGHIHEGKGEKKIGKTIVYNLGEAGYKIIEV